LGNGGLKWMERDLRRFPLVEILPPHYLPFSSNPLVYKQAQKVKET
jgi:hypothetical protein